jgi:hypothetical protein
MILLQIALVSSISPFMFVSSISFSFAPHLSLLILLLFVSPPCFVLCLLRFTSLRCSIFFRLFVLFYFTRTFLTISVTIFGIV